MARFGLTGIGSAQGFARRRLKPTTFFVVASTGILTLQLFGENVVLFPTTTPIGAGPQNSTLTPVVYLYEQGFRRSPPDTRPPWRGSCSSCSSRSPWCSSAARAADAPNLILTGVMMAIALPVTVFVLAKRYFVENLASSAIT